MNAQKKLAAFSALALVGILNYKPAIANSSYYKEDSDYARLLLSLKTGYRVDREQDIDEDVNQELQENLGKLKLANPAVIPRSLEKLNIIGATAMGLYIKDKNGWSGYKLFFTLDADTTCAYSFLDLSLSKDKVKLEHGTMRVTVNGKQAYKLAYGSKPSGYVYAVNWYDDDKVYALDCATKRFNKNMLAAIIAMADAIDGDKT